MKLTQKTLALALVLILASFTKDEKFKTATKAGITINYPLDWVPLKMDGYPILVKEMAQGVNFLLINHHSKLLWR